MSVLGTLFGSLNKKLESSITNLFQSCSGPINAVEVKLKERTVLPEKLETDKFENSVEDVSENISEQADVKEVPTTEIEAQSCNADFYAEAGDKAIMNKKRKKRDEEDNLEAEYFVKLLNDDSECSDSQPTQLAQKNSKSGDGPKGTHVKVGGLARPVNSKEAELEKADRTVFVGNVPNTVISSKQVHKQFKQLLSNLSCKDDDTCPDGDVSFKVESIRYRSISFAEPLPRKVAYIQQKMHSSRDSVNAYVVYSNKDLVPIVCKKLNGIVFHAHHLRFDSISNPAPPDNKRCVFVGNFGFENTEEDLWAHFKSCGSIEYVRIVRDSKTNLGKGFAYVQFIDSSSVNKALLLNEKKMIEGTGKGRKLRVTRCRNIKQLQKRNTQSSNLTDRQKTKLGNVGKVLGKAERAAFLSNKITIEGARASKGESTLNLKRSKKRSKTGRVTKRSQSYKNSLLNDNVTIKK